MFPIFAFVQTNLAGRHALYVVFLVVDPYRFDPYAFKAPRAGHYAVLFVDMTVTYMNGQLVFVEEYLGAMITYENVSLDSVSVLEAQQML